MGFGANLRAARDSRKLTQKQLADAIGAAQSTVAKWEKSRRRPRDIESAGEKLKKALGYTLNELLSPGFTPDRDEKLTVADQPVSPKPPPEEERMTGSDEGVEAIDEIVSAWEEKHQWHLFKRIGRRLSGKKVRAADPRKGTTTS